MRSQINYTINYLPRYTWTPIEMHHTHLQFGRDLFSDI